jgi:hypothetical protein
MNAGGARRDARFATSLSSDSMATVAVKNFSSQALRRVARQERQRLETYRRRVEDRLRAVEREREQLRAELRDLREQAVLLERIAGREQGRESDAAGVVLRGARLREEAARILVEEVGLDRRIHYRDWYGLMAKAGFVVLGKRPLSTFLTGASRSPVVRRGEEPGTYYIDASGLSEARNELDELRAELRDLELVLAREPNPSDALRQHRVKLLASIRRLGGRAAEAEKVLAAARTRDAA